jgi:hypothetical protein
MSNYEVHASPFFVNVTCPKHKNRMIELKNGILGERLWWCDKCERAYHLKPTMMRIADIDREEVDKQLKEQGKL